MKWLFRLLQCFNQQLTFSLTLFLSNCVWNTWKMFLHNEVVLTPNSPLPCFTLQMAQFTVTKAKTPNGLRTVNKTHVHQMLFSYWPDSLAGKRANCSHLSTPYIMEPWLIIFYLIIIWSWFGEHLCRLYTILVGQTTCVTKFKFTHASLEVICRKEKVGSDDLRSS